MIETILIMVLVTQYSYLKCQIMFTNALEHRSIITVYIASYYQNYVRCKAMQ